MSKQKSSKIIQKKLKYEFPQPSDVLSYASEEVEFCNDEVEKMLYTQRRKADNSFEIQPITRSTSKSRRSVELKVPNNTPVNPALGKMLRRNKGMLPQSKKKLESCAEIHDKTDEKSNVGEKISRRNKHARKAALNLLEGIKTFKTSENADSKRQSVSDKQLVESKADYKESANPEKSKNVDGEETINITGAVWSDIFSSEEKILPSATRSPKAASYRVRNEDEGGGIDIDFTINFRKRKGSEDHGEDNSATFIRFGCPAPSLRPKEIWLNGIKVFQAKTSKKDDLVQTSSKPASGATLLRKKRKETTS